MRRERSQEKGVKRRRRNEGLSRETRQAREQDVYTSRVRTGAGGISPFKVQRTRQSSRKRHREGEKKFLYANSESWRF